MNTSIEKIKTKLFAIAPEIFDNHPVLFAYLYGGYAKGVVHPFSDLDIGIYVEKTAKLNHLDLELSLSLEIDEKMKFGVRSEVRISNHLPLMLLGEMITEGTLIYSRDEISRVDFETSVRSAYFDFLPVIQRYNRAYLDRNS